jgi:hypothetical protein
MLLGLMRADVWLLRFALLLLASVSACKSKSGDDAGAREQGAKPAEPPPEGPILRAQTMSKTFATELQSTLLAAIEAGGPAHAISVCKHDAPEIAARQASDGWTLSRTALRVRNPANAPSSWQRDVLLTWQEQIEAGKVDDLASLEWFDIVEGASGKQLRYMRAIPLGGVCLACHGPVDQLSAEVQTALAQQYPEDQATGFAVGELRGAFVVMGPI